jgi:L-threonylcarbamoyladenylate synthase
MKREARGEAIKISTKVLPPTEGNIRKAAAALREGLLVIMPTETVYGLAVDASNRSAVKRLFKVKGRPADNPLIVHVSSIAQAMTLACDWPQEAQTLADRFWPGPLTLVLNRAPNIPLEVVAGLPTVAIRMPSHPVAQALIDACGCPVAAPSANRFMRLSATRVEAVDPAIAKEVAYILNGGPSEVGLESTVVDVTVSPPVILRPGGVSRGEIQAALGMPLGSLPPESVRKSPGLYSRHYAPRARIELVDELGENRVGLTFGETHAGRQIKMPNDPAAYGANLYDALNRLDSGAPKTIFVEKPPCEPEWEAIWDRLRKASGT